MELVPETDGAQCRGTVLEDTARDSNSVDWMSRRSLLAGLGAVTVATLAGCSGTDRADDGGQTVRATETAVTIETSTTTSDGGSSAAKAVDTKLRTARDELEKAFTEMYSIDLVDYEAKVWTPSYQSLGNMDRQLVETRVGTARGALSDAAQLVDADSERATRVELLRHVASIAEFGSEFYYLFALTFEKVYQYEYLIDSENDYQWAVEKMGDAREKLAEWTPLAEKLTDEVKAVKQLYDEHDSIEARVPSFDIGRWNYTTFGAEQYAYLLQPRFVGFEAYAEAVGADLDGLDHLDAEEWQAAQDAFKTARTKIQQAGLQFSEADSRGDSFFEVRARAYENRVPLFEDGFLLHLRAANEFVRGNTKNAKDLRFEGTTKIRNGFAKFSPTQEDAGTPTGSD